MRRPAGQNRDALISTTLSDPGELSKTRATVILMDDGQQTRSASSRGPLSKVFGDDGFSIDIKLRPDELTELRRLTTQAWLDVISHVRPRRSTNSGGSESRTIITFASYRSWAYLDDPHADLRSGQVDVIRCFNLFDS